MRIAAAISLAALIAGCASPRSAPREYLDETTAATITVVAEPWVLVSEPEQNERDFLSLYAIDVNRMGDHRQYLAVLQWWPQSRAASVPSMLELHTSARTIPLRPASVDPRELGIARPLAPAYSPAAVWRYFPVNKETLAAIADTRELRATLEAGSTRLDYTVWRDGSTELAEMTGVLR